MIYLIRVSRNGGAEPFLVQVRGETSPPAAMRVAQAVYPDHAIQMVLDFPESIPTLRHHGYAVEVAPSNFAVHTTEPL